MGVDVTIYFQALKPDFQLERSLGHDFQAVPIGEVDAEYHPGATHKITTFMRYYGQDYERGDWGAIARVLMLLHACPEIKTVWYGGDSDDQIPIITPEEIAELCLYYMSNGTRPYRDYFNR